MAQNNSINKYSEYLEAGADGVGEGGTFTASDSSIGWRGFALSDERNGLVTNSVKNESDGTSAGARVSVYSGDSDASTQVSGGIGAHSDNYSTGPAGFAGYVTTYCNSDADGVKTSLENSTQDYKIQTHSSLATLFTMNGTGERTMPLNPCFQVHNSGIINNVTGNSTRYTIPWNVETFDQGSDFSSTTFTAPVTGKFDTDGAIEFSNFTIACTTLQIRLVTSNRTYLLGNINPSPAASAGNLYLFPFSICADMDAGDTAYMVALGIGESSDVIDFVGDTITSYWSGTLVS